MDLKFWIKLNPNIQEKEFSWPSNEKRHTFKEKLESPMAK